MVENTIIFEEKFFWTKQSTLSELKTDFRSYRHRKQFNSEFKTWSGNSDFRKDVPADDSSSIATSRSKSWRLRTRISSAFSLSLCWSSLPTVVARNICPIVTQPRGWLNFRNALFAILLPITWSDSEKCLKVKLLKISIIKLLNRNFIVLKRCLRLHLC